MSLVAGLWLPATDAIAETIAGCSTQTVATRAGPVCGAVQVTASGKKARAFLGIPYAESTAADRRWTAPVPRKPWQETLSAVRFGPSCPQTIPVPGKKPPDESEDCLSLNVWTPAGAAPSSGRPVMVFIHGGAFKADGSANPMYDGAHLAANRDVVLASFNYRLGVLGFLAADGLSGNYGFRDQQLALAWVRDNIRAFGGDPAKVTIFGESAGAMSVGLHLYSAPASTGLFRAAIMESNFLGLPYKRLADQVDVGNLFKQGLGCADVACLRRIAVEDLLRAQGAFTGPMSTVFSGAKFYIPFAPALDGALLVRQPVEGAAAGVAGKPVLMGTNRNEAIPFVESTSIPVAGYAAWAASIFGRQFERVLARYPARGGPENASLTAQVETEYFLTCSTRRLAARARALTYAYLFNHEPSFQVWGGPACRVKGNVCHGAELPFVFHSAAAIGGRFTDEETKLSEAVMDYWTNFAAHLDPGGDGATRWPRFDARTRRYLDLDAPAISVRIDPYRETCKFWDRMGYDLTDPWGRPKGS